MGGSYLLDSLKLFMRGKYNVSDSDLELLSDILINNGLEKLINDGSFVELLHMLDRNGLKFPISYDYMSQEWNKGITISFNSVLRTLVDLGLVTIKRLTNSTFHNSDIVKSGRETYNEEYYLVIYGTSKYKSLLDEIHEKISLTLTNESELYEGTLLSNMDKKFSDFLVRLKKSVGLVGTILSVESFSDDLISNIFEINLTFTLNKVGASSSDVSKIVKNLNKEKYVKGVESYLDGVSSVFMSISLDRRLLKQDLTRIISLISQVVIDVQSLSL